VTPGVLDCLSRHHVKATFFVLGRKVAAPGGKDLVRRALSEGHWIGNHTFSHSTPLGKLDAIAAIREIERAEESLAWIDPPVRLFRPYGGAGKLGRNLLNSAVVEKLKRDGYTCVLWNSVPKDWLNPDGWVDVALKDVRSREWSLVVLHDLPNGSMAHLDEFLRRLRDDGIGIVQEFPPDCVPIIDGKVVRPIEDYVAR
jgi:peptidoglycan/xylan/chitin deacetylase (PgdA/CDA1 family)